MTTAEITITDIANALRKRIAELEGALSVQILIGSPYMIIVKRPEDDFELVLGTFAKRTEGMGWEYSVNAPHCFVSLSILPDHLCGCSCFSPEGAARAITKVREEHPDWVVMARHILVEKRCRLAKARELLAKLAEIE